MPLFNFRKRADETPPATTEEKKETAADDLLLSAFLNQEVITRDKAMMIPAVSSSVEFISNAIACMPVKLYKIKKTDVYGKDGEKFTRETVEEITDDTRTQVLNNDTNDTLDGFQMKKAVVEDYLLGKGGYIYIQRVKNDVKGLFYVKDNDIDIYTKDEPIFKSYSIMVGANRYMPHEFIKLLRNTKDGASGTGLTTDVSKALETAFATMCYQLGLVKTGGNKKGFLKSDHKLASDEFTKLKKAWRNLYANNEESIVILNKGLEFQEASNSSVEMQLDQNKKTLANEIKNIFQIGDNFDETFKTAIYPIVKAFETALNRDLLLEKEKGKKFFKFDVKEIVRANLKDRYDAYKKALDAGWITINEVRRDEDMNRIEGLDVVNIGLKSVLYDANTHKFYTPNTGQVIDAEEATAEDAEQGEEKTDEEVIVKDDIKAEIEGGQNAN